jgi:hypothetical protein
VTAVLALTPWGLLPIAVPLGWVTVRGLGMLVLPRASGFDSVLAGGVLTLALVAVGVRVLGAFGLLTTPVLFGALVVFALCVVVAARGVWRRLPWRRAVSMQTLPVLVVAGVAVAFAVAAEYYLPIWQWDALGYHLPYVNFALQRGTFADIPGDARYISTYPHVVEYAFIAWRAMLPDDRLVDLAQLPFGLLGSLAIATVARAAGARAAGARADHAVAAGAAWLTLPAVFLQLPTNYVDVASAGLMMAAIAFILGPIDARRVLLAGVAIGLLLGSKPTALVPALVLLAALVIRTRRSGVLRFVLPAGLVALMLGAEAYLVNVVRHGNPIWPVRVGVGPVHLPGEVGASELLGSGAAAPRTHGNLVERVIGSWTNVFPPQPVFDMRIGGLGLVFLIALPFAVVHAVRHRSTPLALAVVATLATPDPAVARYVLAFAGLVLALAVPMIESVRAGAGAVAFALVAFAAVQGIVVAYPGLTGEGPRLSAYVHMTLAQRQRAVGADGAPTPYLDAIAHVGPGEITVFDRRAELPYFAWPFDLSRHAARIPDDATAEEARRIVDDPRVRMLVVGDDTVAGAIVKRDPQRFVPQFACKSAPCTVYLRR